MVPGHPSLQLVCCRHVDTFWLGTTSHPTCRRPVAVGQLLSTTKLPCLVIRLTRSTRGAAAMGGPYWGGAGGGQGPNGRPKVKG